MQKYYVAIIASIIFFSLVLLAIRAWRARAIKQEADFSQPPMALAQAENQLLDLPVFYVATTYADNHLERIRAYGLGVRGSARALVFEGGLQLIRKGELPLAIAKEVTTRLSTNQVVIDRVTESNGLVTVDWHHDGTDFSTHLRVIDSINQAQLLSALRNLCNGEAKQ